MCEWLNSFYAKKEYIEILKYLDTNQKAGVHYNNKIMVMSHALKRSNDELERLCTELVDCGYITAKEPYGVTENGTDFLYKSSQFKILGATAKFTKIIQNNFSGIVSILAIIISVVTLIFKK